MYSSQTTFFTVVVCYNFNGAADTVSIRPDEKQPVVSVAEYRKLLNDYSSSDEQILARIEYLEALCRNTARGEIEAYVKSIKSNKKA